MIDYNIEFTKGVLFVRLCGLLNNKNYIEIENELFDIINEGGIRYLVFNNENLDLEDDVPLFKNCEKIVRKNDGKMLICGNEMYINNFNYVDDELSALKRFQIC